MLKLIKNEYIKVFRKISTYILLGLCMLVSIGINIVIQTEYEEDNDFDIKYEETLEINLSYYESEQSDSELDNVLLKVFAQECRILMDMGYTYQMEAPDWIVNAVEDVCGNHLIHDYASEYGGTEILEDVMDIYVDYSAYDVEYEKKMAEAKLSHIKAFDYKGYSEKCMEYIEHQKKLNLQSTIFYDGYDYEYHNYIVKNDINPAEDEEKITLISIFSEAKAGYDELLEKSKNGEGVSDFALEQKKEVYEVYKYILDNNIDHYMTKDYEDSWKLESDKFITSLTSNTIVATIAGIFVMIIAAGIIANEFSDGTIKFLLINPVKRAKIFWSKYITCISLLGISMMVFFVIHLLFCVIVCGSDGLSGVYISYSESAVYEQSIILYSFKQYLLCGVSLLTTVTLAFTISSLARNNALAIALSIAIEISGATITLFLSELGHDWGRYLLFSNTDITSISTGNVNFPGQTVGFAVMVLVVYLVIFLLMAYDGFKKKDV